MTMPDVSGLPTDLEATRAADPNDPSVKEHHRHTDIVHGAVKALPARANHTGTQPSSSISDFTEAAQDAVAAMLAAGTGVTLSYNDAGNTLTVTSTATGGVTDPEVVRDTIGTALIGVGAVSVAVNDAADTITITTTATANSTDAQLRDRTTHEGTQDVSTLTGQLSLERLPLGSDVTIDYNKAFYGAASAWPTSRPSARTDLCFIWRGPSDPGVIAIAGDVIDLVG